MKILQEKSFKHDIFLFPGDEIYFTWEDEDNVVCTKMHMNITKEQILNTVILVKLSKKESKKLGLKDAITMVSGNRYENNEKK